MKNMIFYVACIIFLAAAIIPVSSISTASFFFNTTTDLDQTEVFDSIIHDSTVSFQVVTDRDAECRYSVTDGLSYDSMEGRFAIDFGTLHKVSLTGLSDGNQEYYVRCETPEGSSQELEAVFHVIAPVSADISLSKESPVDAGQLVITLSTSKPVVDVPSLFYSFDSTSYKPIALSGSGTTWTGVLIIDDSEGEKVGSFKFEATDIDGNKGELITSGKIFLVDTKKPGTIIDVDARGFDGLVRLTWRFDEDVETFNIYRSTSPQVDFADLYKEVDEQSTYSDTNVEAGKTYYYRVTGVDSAGNEGDLSVEVRATALLENGTENRGLPLELLGQVDNQLARIDGVIQEIDLIEQQFGSGTKEGSEIFKDLRLEREFNSARSALVSLKSEVQGYKTQSLTDSELSSKLDAAEIRVNAIKKQVPDTIIMIDESSADRESEQDRDRELILSIHKEITESEASELEILTSDFMEGHNYRSHAEAYNFEIVYLDGSRREMALVMEEIETDISEEDNVTIVMSLPSEIASDSNDIEFKEGEAELLDESLVFGFSPETRTISYVIREHISIESIEDIMFTVVHDPVAESEAPKVTGYFSFIKENPGGFTGLLIGFLVIMGLAGYFVYLKYDRRITEEILPLQHKAEHAMRILSDGHLTQAEALYEEMKEEYKDQNRAGKSKIYPMMEQLHSQIREKKGGGHG